MMNDERTEKEETLEHEWARIAKRGTNETNAPIADWGYAIKVEDMFRIADCGLEEQKD